MAGYPINVGNIMSRMITRVVNENDRSYMFPNFLTMYFEDQDAEGRRLDLEVKPKCPFFGPKGKATTSTSQSEEPVVAVPSSQPPTATPDTAPGPSTATAADIPSSSAYPLTAHCLSQTLAIINNWMLAATSKLFVLTSLVVAQFVPPQPQVPEAALRPEAGWRNLITGPPTQSLHHQLGGSPSSSLVTSPTTAPAQAWLLELGHAIVALMASDQQPSSSPLLPSTPSHTPLMLESFSASLLRLSAPSMLSYEYLQPPISTAGSLGASSGTCGCRGTDWAATELESTNSLEVAVEDEGISGAVAVDGPGAISGVAVGGREEGTTTTGSSDWLVEVVAFPLDPEGFYPEGLGLSGLFKLYQKRAFWASPSN
ncbi:PREDICTED: putative uncharacterized protein DDB_G0290521 [Nicotiana attenuata]|uniref:putative uncharacterized protein DDB_G0290521 n=1 Tax=Nicotiana attenuata TaxID=49451 RepID=UPI000905BFF4|nr:PREDICTED: putative uncharacterized protein DDB_G0290521 [Nicotiana attenuata]